MYKMSIPIPDDLAALVKQAAAKDSRSFAGFVKLAIKEKADKTLNKRP